MGTAKGDPNIDGGVFGSGAGGSNCVTSGFHFATGDVACVKGDLVVVQAALSSVPGDIERGGVDMSCSPAV